MRLSSPEDVPAMRPAMRGAALAEPVIATKLFVPALGTRSVQRPRLRNALDKARNARLALVVAPAGWGKSTLLAQWLCDGGVPCGWLSLDAADDDVTRFWRYLLVAVQQADAGVGSAALRRLDTAGVDVERDVLPVLVNELAGAGRDLLLVLDDYHLVRSRPVHRSVAGLLDHAPPSLHLVISSRTDPPLPLSRLRVAGDLVEVRAEQLRFTAEEAASMLHRAAVSQLSAGEVQRLVDRTEGWAVGLQLAALRLADRADRQARVDFVERFTGADRHIVDYVGEEVLDALPSQLRDFLLQTSVLSRLSAPLANAVTEGTDAARMLAEIQRGNLFLTALDDEGRWYRYHQLFRDLLTFELQRSGLVEPTVLHRRAAERVRGAGGGGAAEWFRGHGELGEAVLHALSSGDLGFAAELIAQGWRPEFNLGHLQTVQGWLTALPPAKLAADPRLTEAQVWLYLDRGRLDDAAASLSAAERTAADDGHLRVLRALHTFKRGNVPLAAEWLGAVRGRMADPFLVTVQDLLAGVCGVWLGETAEAADRLRRAADRAEETGNRLARIYALGAQALLAILTGDLLSAETVLNEADSAVADGLSDAHFVAMFPALAAARLAALRGRWDDAVVSATSAAELAGRGAGRVEQAAAMITAAEAARPAGGGGGGGVEACVLPGPVGVWGAAPARGPPSGACSRRGNHSRGGR